ncbi:MAG: hypothetical protein LQ343_004198 [Gyalolechia ehrenbergii]|nr:MAG: hypothetical protein LQ343_004198 [Gyalolechia ehrenbergii]
MAITLSQPRIANPPFKLPRPPIRLSTPHPLQPHQPPPHLLPLPPRLLQQILSHLLTSTSPLLLRRDNSTPSAYRTQLTTSILLVNRQLYHNSLPILYGKNTFTTTSPATSYDFDAHLLSIPGRCRQMITKVVLEISWGAQLWMKFPLVAARVGELKGLKELKLEIVDKGEDEQGEVVKGKGDGETMAGLVVKREGKAAAAMLKAEKRVLRELVVGLEGLRVFELQGFEDEVFARGLEDWVRYVGRG